MSQADGDVAGAAERRRQVLVRRRGAEVMKMLQGRGPKPGVKTFAASTEEIGRFPLHVEIDARRRGLMAAREVVFIGDGGSFVRRTALEVCEDREARGKTVHEILDKLRPGEVEIPTRSRMKPIAVIGPERTSMDPAA